MTWTECLGNSLPITSIYPKIPSLNNVRLHEVRLHQDGPTVSLRFDLDSYPDNPPAKWVVGGYNRAQLTLMLIGVFSLQIQGWELDNIGHIALVRSNEVVRLEFAGGTTQIVCSSQFVEVEKISGYCSFGITVNRF